MKKNDKNQEQAMLELKVVRELLDAKTKSGEDMYCYILREMITVNARSAWTSLPRTSAVTICLTSSS